MLSLAKEQAAIPEKAAQVEAWMREACKLVSGEPGFPAILAQLLTASDRWADAQAWLQRWAELAQDSTDTHPLFRAIVQTQHVPETLNILEKTST